MNIFTRQLRGNLTERFAALVANKSMDGVLGPYAGQPERLRDLGTMAQCGGMVAFLAASVAHGFGFDISTAAQVALAAGAAVATGAVAVCIRHQRRQKEPSRDEQRFEALVEQFGRIDIPNRDRPSDDVDPSVVRKMAKLTSSLPGALARKSIDGWWIRPEGNDTRFTPVNQKQFEAFCHRTNAAGLRLTIVEAVANQGLLVRSYRGGVLDSIMPDRPAVMQMDTTGLAVEFWRGGAKVADAFEPRGRLKTRGVAPVEAEPMASRRP